MASARVRSKAVVLLLLIHCLLLLKGLVALLLLSSTVSVLCLFLTVPWVGLQFVIVIFPDHTRFLVLLFYGSSLRCRGLFSIVRLWYFLIILTSIL